MTVPLVALVESAQQLGFFARFAPAAEASGFRLQVITARWSDAVRARRKKLDCVLVQSAGDTGRTADIDGTGELVTGVFTWPEAERYHAAFVAAMHRLVHTSPSGIVLMWGGGDTVASRAVRGAAVQHGWRTLYVDRANIPGRIIADPWGMNFNSFLHRHPELLEGGTMGDPTREMRAVLEQDHHAASTKRVRNWLLPADILVSHINGIPFRGGSNTRRRLVLPDSLVDTRPLTAERITLVPLDHSFELLSVQDGGLDHVEHQLLEADRVAAQHGTPVVVTMHPLEHHPGLIARLGALRERMTFTVRTEPSSTLLGRTVAVVASNTSVALHALIRGIPVVHVGRTMFGGMDRDRLAAYIERYLLPIDVVSTAPVPEREFRRMIERTEWR